MKEKLRMILKSHDAEKARFLLDQWRWRVSHSRIESFRELSRKIKRNQEFILNTIRYGLSNVRVGCADKNLDQGIRKRGMDVRTGRASRYSRKASAVIGELGYLMLAK